MLDRLRTNYVVEADGCWRWTGRINDRGYGRLGPRLAHRVAYEELVGPIPDGLTLDHLCRNPPCINPAHLEPVTMLENIQRGDVVGKGWRREITQCPKGHTYDAANTYWHNDRRQCRTCKRERNRIAERSRVRRKVAA